MFQLLHLTFFFFPFMLLHLLAFWVTNQELGFCKRLQQGGEVSEVVSHHQYKFLFTRMLKQKENFSRFLLSSFLPHISNMELTILHSKYSSLINNTATCILSSTLILTFSLPGPKQMSHNLSALLAARTRKIVTHSASSFIWELPASSAWLKSLILAER